MAILAGIGQNLFEMSRSICPEAPLSEARNLLQKVFGFPDFVGEQRDVIQTVFEGQDCLAILPTGSGKSLCYQLPALVMQKTVVVISPLLALMEDQCFKLQKIGIRARFFNSTLNDERIRQVQAEFESGGLDLLYVSPERAVQAEFEAMLHRGNVGLFAIDEAHCIARWGHDFRPEYKSLGVIAARHPEIPFLALTASADPKTRDEIIEALGLREPCIIQGSLNRPNLFYRVEEKKQARQRILDFIQKEYSGQSGIIYCASRKTTENLAEWLNTRGVRTLAYHAGLDAEERMKRQHEFLGSNLVMTATVAFGMGIDKPDVRFVIHHDLPQNLESWYQETGRAGRDGNQAQTLLLYGLQDWMLRQQQIQRAPLSPQRRELETKRLTELLDFCESAHCRTQKLLGFFGEEMSEGCGHCDNCLHGAHLEEVTEDAQRILSCVVRVGQQFGVSHIIDVLRGRSTDRVLEFDHRNLSTFGIGLHRSVEEWRRLIRQLFARSYLRMDERGFGAIRLTPEARGVLRGEVQVHTRIKAAI